MPERSHLSIGEVLSLLRDEFPDVTISKIRFLESQGLVDPERTPSGYRKFYEHDVERLRWILRQQREHFLPLKVIRGRLSEQGESLPASVAAPAASGTASVGPAPPRPATRGPGPVAEAGPLAPRGASAGAVDRPGQDTPPPAPSPGEAGGSGPGGQVGAGTPETTRAEGAAAGPPALETSHPEPPAGPPPGGGRAPLPTPSLFAELHSSRAVRHPGPPPPPPPQRSPSSRATAPTRTGPERDPEHRWGSYGDDRGQTDTYNADELAAAAGGTPRLVSELEQFGLISTHAVVAGTPYFDARALAVTKAAAALSRHGVEVRHMRIWRNAADRETDLYQQIVLPLLRQRNPQARHQATETLDELARLGGDMRRALVERAVGEIR